jgi:cystathionine gamma-synthase
MMRMDTLLAQVGNRKDPRTGAISLPIYHSTTFAHPALGQSTGFDYTRTINPTRKVLEEAIAELEGGCRGFAFASGMAAVSCVFTLFRPGDHLIVSNDLYGGTYRLLEQVLRPFGLEATYVDTSDLNAVEASLLPSTKAVFVETPTNPTMKITDLRGLCQFAKRHNILSIVDNTFMTPYLQRPLDWGADLVVHSATKYLGGHNDVLAGLVVARDPELAERLFFLQNSIGAVLGPQDCWLLLRGIKTLALRMERHQENACRVAQWLAQHPLVEKVYYPGLENHPGYEVQKKQSKGFGGMLSFDVVDERLVEHILSAVRLITFAESLGGVESLITYPARQTHFDIPEEIRNALGVTNRLLRFSVGIEHYEDIISDLDHALTVADSVLKRS